MVKGVERTDGQTTEQYPGTSRGHPSSATPSVLLCHPQHTLLPSTASTRALNLYHCGSKSKEGNKETPPRSNTSVMGRRRTALRAGPEVSCPSKVSNTGFTDFQILVSHFWGTSGLSLPTCPCVQFNSAWPLPFLGIRLLHGVATTPKQ